MYYITFIVRWKAHCWKIAIARDTTERLASAFKLMRLTKNKYVHMCLRPMKCGRWKTGENYENFGTTRNLHLINCLDRYLVHNFRFIETHCVCVTHWSTHRNLAFGTYNDVIKFHLHFSRLLLAQTHIVIISAKRRETTNHNGTAGEGETQKLFLNNNVRVLIIQYLRFCGLHWSHSTQPNTVSCSCCALANSMVKVK